MISPPILPSGFRVVNLDINAAFGHLVSIVGIPQGWTLVVDHDPSGRVRLSGGIGVGAAALEKADLGKLSFSFEPDAMIGARPECSGSIDYTRDFNHVDTRLLTDRDFAIDDSSVRP